MTPNLLLYDMPDFSSPEVWVSLLTLIFLEIVLGVDNIIFITIAANKLPEEQQPKARNVGLLLAMAIRIVLLFGIGYVIALQETFFHFDWGFMEGGLTGQSLILMLGGLFLIYKATREIDHKLEGDAAHQASQLEKVATSLSNVIIQITLINIIFSVDSILTAIGLTDNVIIMVIGVVVSIIVMMLFAGPVGNFVNQHPTVQMLGLAFLILIGFMLIAEGAHLAHLVIAGQEVGSVPKGYLYFAIAFSLFVEFLNLRLRRETRQPVQLRGVGEEAVREGVIGPASKG